MRHKIVVQETLFGEAEQTPEALGGLESADFPDSTLPECRPFRSLPDATPTVLDLFTGMGGMAVGFRNSGFKVVGVDHQQWTAEVYEQQNIGEARIADLLTDTVSRDVPVLTGGPPCRPWSVMNQHLRGDDHPDQALLGRFFHHVELIQPEIFLMENVPALQFDATYQHWWKRMEHLGYGLGCDLFCYANYGAATSRRRLFTIGVRNSRKGALEFLVEMRSRQRSPATMRDAIWPLRSVPYAGVADHVWPQLTTIGDYAERYETGQYGWRRLEWDEPAPSFGNISKTYILHPDSAPSDPEARVLSVRELAMIMGFGESFTFPDRMPLALRYQMLADTISPVFSQECADVIYRMLWHRNVG